jgi:hypothetical protein
MKTLAFLRLFFATSALVGFSLSLKATSTSASVAGNWATAGTWSNGVPTSTSDVTISAKSIVFNATPVTVHNLSLLGTVSGAGVLSDAGSRVLNIDGTFTVTGYSATNTATTTVKTININSGGNLTVNNFGIVSGVSGSVLNILAGATANLNDGSTVSRAVNNFSTITQTGILSAGNTITNKSGANFNVTGTGEIQTGSFVNENGANLTKVGGGQSDMKLAVNNKAGGTITVTNGILQLNSTVDNASTILVSNANPGNELHSLTGVFTNKNGGSITVQSGAAWNNDSTFYSQQGSTISNAGTIQFASGTATFEGTTGIAGSGDTSFQSNSTAIFDGTNFINNSVTFLGTVTGTSSTLAVNGPATWNGSINVGTDTVINFNNSLAITGDYDASGGSNAAAVAHGSTTIADSKYIITAAGGSNFTNASTGTFTMANDDSGISGDGQFVNQGTFTKSSTGQNVLDTASFVNDGGTVAINSGSLAAVNGATFTQQGAASSTNLVAGASLGESGSALASATFDGGILTGNGTLAADTTTFNNTSIVSPGNSIGTLHFDGNMVVNSGATYNVELFSTPTSPGVSNDFMDISGSLQLPVSGFTLSVSSIGGGGLINGFLDSGSYTWTIASAIGGIVGFSGFNGANITLDLTGIGNAYTGTWGWGAVGNDLLLTYTTSIAPVPEPSTYAAFGVAICGALVFWRRRQRARLAATAVATA